MVKSVREVLQDAHPVGSTFVINARTTDHLRLLAENGIDVKFSSSCGPLAVFEVVKHKREDNYSDYFDKCPVGTVYATTVDYGPELAGETSVWKFLYNISLTGDGKDVYKYERVG